MHVFRWCLLLAFQIFLSFNLSCYGKFQAYVERRVKGQASVVNSIFEHLSTGCRFLSYLPPSHMMFLFSCSILKQSSGSNDSLRERHEWTGHSYAFAGLYRSCVNSHAVTWPAARLMFIPGALYYEWMRRYPCWSSCPLKPRRKHGSSTPM